MRLHRLEIEGFGPFRSRQVVDFDAFADDGIFLIAGRTGAGKSSILDAVCFGLYGGVPRYESGDKRLRSDHCAPDDITEVAVEFSTTAGRFRVTRSPEYSRPAKRGGGMTKQASSVALEEWTDAGWIGRAARAVDVAGELETILQLNQQQFLQVILLAQNRFARFLLADSKDRQQLLRKLFGTERFGDVQARFDERRKASELALGARRATVDARVEEAEGLVTAEGLWGAARGASSQGPVESMDGDGGAGLKYGRGEVSAGFEGAVGEGDAEPVSASGDDAAEPVDADAADIPPADRAGVGTTAERLEALRRAQARAAYRVERRTAERDEANLRFTAAEERLAAAREEQKAQQERDRARAALAVLDDAEPQIAEDRRTLERARSAETLRPTLTALTRAESALTAAAAAEQTARSAWEETEVALDENSASALRAWADARIRESGTWQRAAELEADAPTRDAALLFAQETVATATASTESIEQERVALPAQLAEVTTARDSTRRLADRVDELARLCDEARARRDAARNVERLESEQHEAEQALAASSAVLATAQATLASLRQRRLDGFAGELATDLADGEACPVCGATEHPAPATHTDPVSADDIARSEQERDAAAQQERDAAERASVLRAELAVERTRAAGRAASQAEAELVVATDELARSAAAVEQLAALDVEVEGLQARVTALEQERAAAAQALSAARESLVAREQSAREAVALITEARGVFDTVAERLDEAKGQIARATALASAIEEHERRLADVAGAESEQAAALAASVFDRAGEAMDALRSIEEQEAVEKRIATHAVQREKERAVLLELELRTLPEEPIDLTPITQTVSTLREIWMIAVDGASRAVGVAERLIALIDSAELEHARSAEQAADHEVLRDLADTIAGRGANTHKMALETFVLAAELEEIVAAANRRLGDMSTGRYQLRHSDALAARGAASGLGIVVFDAFTGQTRPAQSLSGGETFLSSLALALGLAEVVTARAGGIQLDTLFIDEGFGSLDGDTLDVAMRTLDELRAGGRTVGVISHVEAMQEQIPAQLIVEQTDSGPSRIRT